MTVLRLSLAVAAAFCVTALVPPVAHGQDEEEEHPGWHDTAELSFVLTTGNAEASTIGFANQLRHVWENALWQLGAGGIRVESTPVGRTAIGTSPDDFRIEEEDESELTAESYFVRSRYDRELSASLFWFAGGGWDRNTFAGIENRYSGGAGVGNIWFSGDAAGFRTDYGLTYTFQDNVVGGDDTFAGLRLGYDYYRMLTGTTRFESVLIADESLEETADFRTDLLNALAVAMSERLSLKVSHRILFDNRPSLESLPLIGLNGTPTGESVLAELDEVDTTLTVALVLDF
ncbi:MAG: DUF481 domain-containing protein [Gemmatimonadota bacterium]